MASSNPTTWPFSCCGGGGLPDADLDAAVARLGDLVRRRNLGLAPAAARDRDPDPGGSELQELVTAALGPPEREHRGVLLGGDAVPGSDDHAFPGAPPGGL